MTCGARNTSTSTQNNVSRLFLFKQHATNSNIATTETTERKGGKNLATISVRMSLARDWVIARKTQCMIVIAKPATEPMTERIAGSFEFPSTAGRPEHPRVPAVAVALDAAHDLTRARK